MAKNFELKGAKELEKLLLGLGPTVTKKISGPALRKSAAPIVRSAKSKVRVEKGNLKRKIAARVLRAKWNSRTVLIGIAAGGVPDDRRSSGVDVPARRAHFEEFGRDGQPAHPFLRPAVDEQGGAALDTLGRELGAGIIKATKKN